MRKTERRTESIMHNKEERTEVRIKHRVGGRGENKPEENREYNCHVVDRIDRETERQRQKRRVWPIGQLLMAVNIYR